MARSFLLNAVASLAFACLARTESEYTVPSVRDTPNVVYAERGPHWKLSARSSQLSSPLPLRAASDSRALLREPLGTVLWAFADHFLYLTCCWEECQLFRMTEGGIALEDVVCRR